MQDLLINHTIDVMHTEKNICENMIRTIFGEKDTVKVRMDMELQNVNRHLWLQQHPSRAGVLVRPLAPYVLRTHELQTFLTIVSKLKVPSGYAASFKKHVQKKKLGGMKSHDYHVLMQQILPLCVRTLMDEGPRMTIMRLSRVFRRICGKVWDPSQSQTLKSDVALTLCMMEIHFPASFFDVMTHLIVHLVEEVDLCGPPSCRWMYPVERYLKTLKGYVRNKSRPEASMAEGYIVDESMGFMTEYMQAFEAVETRVWDSNEEEGVAGEVLEGGRTISVLTTHMRDMAHTYVLHNTTIMAPWLE